MDNSPMLSRFLDKFRRTRRANRGATPRRRGVASVLAMMYLLIFAALALGFYAATNMSAQLSSNEQRTIEAQLAAESAVSFLQYHLSAVNIPGNRTPEQAFEALYTQLQGRLLGTGNLGGKAIGYRPTAPGTPGEIRIPDLAADRIKLTPNGPGFRAVITDGSPLTVKFVGAARQGAASRAVQLKFQRAPKPYVLVGINSLTLSGNAYTDSYDASKGDWSVATARNMGSVGSNGSITLTGNALVKGDVRYGMSPATFSVTSPAAVNGMAAPITSPLVYPSAVMPASGVTPLGNVNITSGTHTNAGGVYSIDNLTLDGTGSPVVINWSGPVTLYIRNSYNVSGNVTINTFDNKPRNRVIYFLPTCTTASWTGNNVCVGDLYAPDTAFTVGGSVVKKGRIIAKSINNSSSGGMHYDESLPAPAGQISYMPLANSYLEVSP